MVFHEFPKIDGFFRCYQAESPNDHPELSQRSFDCISCLNVLDRCDKPVSLLKGFSTLLKPNGVLLLAVVLPFESFVEDGSGQRKPTEKIKVQYTPFLRI